MWVAMRSRGGAWQSEPAVAFGAVRAPSAVGLCGGAATACSGQGAGLAPAVATVGAGGVRCGPVFLHRGGRAGHPPPCPHSTGIAAARAVSPQPGRFWSGPLRVLGAHPLPLFWHLPTPRSPGCCSGKSAVLGQRAGGAGRAELLPAPRASAPAVPGAGVTVRLGGVQLRSLAPVVSGTCRSCPVPSPAVIPVPSRGRSSRHRLREVGLSPGGEGAGGVPGAARG